MFGAGECDEEVAKKHEDKLSAVLDVYENILEKQPVCSSPSLSTIEQSKSRTFVVSTAL